MYFQKYFNFWYSTEEGSTIKAKWGIYMKFHNVRISFPVCAHDVSKPEILTSILVSITLDPPVVLSDYSTYCRCSKLPGTSWLPTWPYPTSSSACSRCPSPWWTSSKTTGPWGRIGYLSIAWHRISSLKVSWNRSLFHYWPFILLTLCRSGN